MGFFKPLLAALSLQSGTKAALKNAGLYDDFQAQTRLDLKNKNFIPGQTVATRLLGNQGGGNASATPPAILSVAQRPTLLGN